jgi:hypothetical protein
MQTLELGELVLDLKKIKAPGPKKQGTEGPN